MESLYIIVQKKSLLLFLVTLIAMNYFPIAKTDYDGFGSWLVDTQGIIAAENDRLKFRDCGGRKSLIHIKKLKVEPSKFKLPQNISVTALLKIDEDIEYPIKSELVMRKDIPYVGLVEIPCIKSFGSCTYHNICDMLELGSANANHVARNTTNACAWVKAFGLPCSCPIRKGTYIADKVNLPLAGSLLPEFVESGKYDAYLRILQDQRTIGCFTLSFTIL